MVEQKLVDQLLGLAKEAGKKFSGLFRRSYAGYKTIRAFNRDINPKNFDEIYNQALYNWEYAHNDIREIPHLFSSKRARTALNEALSKTEGNDFESELITLIATIDHYELLRTVNFDLKEKIESFLDAFEKAVQSARSTDAKQVHKKLDTIIAGQALQNKQEETVLPDFNPEITKEINYIPRTYTRPEHRNPYSQVMDGRVKLNLYEALQEHQLITITGNGGSGKSTDLIQLLFIIGATSSALIPIYCQLKLLKSRTLEELLPPRWDHVPKDGLLLLLDGLDEAMNTDRSNAITEIQRFVSRQPLTKIIVSCRAVSYELPIAGSEGTLPGFSVFEINDLSAADIKRYARQVFHLDGEKFLEDSLKDQYLDLIGKPFFLKNLLEIYQAGNTYPASRKQVFDTILQKIVTHDRNHFRHITEFNDMKKKLMPSLERIAVAMEMMGKNFISEEEMDQILPEPSDRSLLQYYQGLAIYTYEEKRHYQFTHNNIQELQAANFISRLSFEQLISLITLIPGSPAINPTWANTLAFLFGILNTTDPLLQQLVDYMMDSGQEKLLLQFERDKVSPNIRKEIFYRIYHKSAKTGTYIGEIISRTEDLARFCQSEEMIADILNDLLSGKSEEVTSNALSVARYITDMTPAQLIQADTAIFQIIEHAAKDDLVTDAIKCVTGLKRFSKPIVEKLMDLMMGEKRERVRNAVYAYLDASGYSDRYFSFFTDGYKMTIRRELLTQNSLQFLDYNLKQVLSHPKNAGVLQELTEFLTTDPYYIHGNDVEEFLTALIDNTIELGSKDAGVFSVMLQFAKDVSTHYYEDELKEVLRYFTATGSSEKAFRSLCNKTDLSNPHFYTLIPLIAPPDISFSILLQAYKNKELEETHLLQYHYLLGGQSVANAEAFDEYLRQNSNIKIAKREGIDWQSINRLRLEQKFNILFDKEGMLNELQKIFNHLGKHEGDPLEESELRGLRSKSYRETDPEKTTNDSAIECMRDLLMIHTSIKKKELRELLDHHQFFDQYRLTAVMGLLRSNNDAHKAGKLSDAQKNSLLDWCTTELPGIDFNHIYDPTSHREANWKAVFVAFCVSRLGFIFDSDKMLDMVSFDLSHYGAELKMDWFKKHCGETKLKERILYNITHKLCQDYASLLSHAKFILQTHLKEGYPLIERDILDNKVHRQYQLQLLNLYLIHVSETAILKEFINQPMPFELWFHAVTKIRTSGRDATFLEPILTQALSKSTDEDEKIKIANELTSFQNLDGLKILSEAFFNDPVHLGEILPEAFRFFHSITGIDTMMEIYKDFYRMRFDKTHKEHTSLAYLEQNITGYLYSVSAQSYAYFEKIKEKLEALVDDHPAWKEYTKKILRIIRELETHVQMVALNAQSLKDILHKIDSLNISQ